MNEIKPQYLFWINIIGALVSFLAAYLFSRMYFIFCGWLNVFAAFLIYKMEMENNVDRED